MRKSHTVLPVRRSLASTMDACMHLFQAFSHATIVPGNILPVRSPRGSPFVSRAVPRTLLLHRAITGTVMVRRHISTIAMRTDSLLRIERLRNDIR
jgi:hypothetical protein